MSHVIQSLKGAELHGYDLQRLLRKSDIDERLFMQPEARVPLEKFIMLTRYTSGTMKDELHGLLQFPHRLGHFRSMALSAIHGGTLGEAIQRCVEFSNLFENSFVYELHKKDQYAQYSITRIEGHKIQNSFAVESILTVMHRFAGWLVNERIIPDQVGFDFSMPPHAKEYQHVFYGAPILYKQDFSSFRFPISYLDRSIVQTEANLNSYIRRAPMDLYLPLNAAGELTLNIRSLVEKSFTLYNQPPSLEEISHTLSLKPQTLRRYLKKEGSSFHQIKGQVRRDIAINYLGGNELSIEEISEQSGYTEPSAFIRAFKMWTGFTPLQFRKGLEL